MFHRFPHVDGSCIHAELKDIRFAHVAARVKEAQKNLSVVAVSLSEGAGKPSDGTGRVISSHDPGPDWSWWKNLVYGRTLGRNRNSDEQPIFTAYRRAGNSGLV